MTDTPKLERVSRDILEIVCEHVLTSRHAAQWGRSYTVVGTSNSLDDAIQWFANEVALVLRDLGVAVTTPGLPDTPARPEWGFEITEVPKSAVHTGEGQPSWP